MPYEPGPSHTSKPARDSLSPLRSRLYGINGAILIITALGVGVVGSILLSLIDEALIKTPEHRARMPGLVMNMVELGPWVMAIVLPSAIIGFWMMLSSRRLNRAAAWLLLLAAYGWTVLVLAGLLAAFIQFALPLYEYEPLN